MKRLVQLILKILARLYLRKFKPKVIAVTGSVGKTSTKEAIGLALQGAISVRVSAKSYNNEIGVPLAILGFKSPARSVGRWLVLFVLALWRWFWLRDYPKVLVLEMGADKPGDLAYLVKIAKPDIAVITRIGPAHFEAFEDMEQLVQEKSTLVRCLRPGDWAVLNGDDEIVREIGLRAPAKVLYYAIKNPEAQVRGSQIKLADDGALSFTISYRSKNYPLKIRAAGRHFVYVALAAFAVGTALGIEPSLLVRNLARFEPLPGRGKILKGKRRTVLIDESYNANPLSMEASLAFIKKLNWPGRKVLVLGDMKELGSLSEKEHKRLATKSSFADLVILVGPEIRPAFDSLAKKGVPCLYYAQVEDLIPHLSELVRPRDLILFKGSQAIRLEKAVAELLSGQYNPKEVLVRQEEEWQRGK